MDKKQKQFKEYVKLRIKIDKLRKELEKSEMKNAEYNDVYLSSLLVYFSRGIDFMYEQDIGDDFKSMKLMYDKIEGSM